MFTFSQSSPSRHASSRNCCRFSFMAEGTSEKILAPLAVPHAALLSLIGRSFIFSICRHLLRCFGMLYTIRSSESTTDELSILSDTITPCKRLVTRQCTTLNRAAWMHGTSPTLYPSHTRICPGHSSLLAKKRSKYFPWAQAKQLFRALSQCSASIRQFLRFTQLRTLQKSCQVGRTSAHWNVLPTVTFRGLSAAP